MVDDDGLEGAIKIKICGVTLDEDAERVAAAGVDFVGLNFWPRSRRRVDAFRAAQLADAVREAGLAQVVGVFVDASAAEIAAVLEHVELDVIQLHGAETPEDAWAIVRATGRPVWKAIAAGAPADVEQLEVWPVDAILLDTPTPGRGGSGVPFDWDLARAARARHPARRLVLAGGLGPHNVGAAIAAAEPWAVDVASGVEAAPGVKDPAKLAAFIAAVRGGDGRDTG
jgi:phosphoribosylanthranilate isomerase